jgi:hypothetical protein
MVTDFDTHDPGHAAIFSRWARCREAEPLGSGHVVLARDLSLPPAEIAA